MAALSELLSADLSQFCQELIERLDTLRRNESFCDVIVAVKGKEFKAHKVVLAAASPFFLSLLESDMRENNEQLIRIELEEATASVMEDVLKYAYTEKGSVTEHSCSLPQLQSSNMAAVSQPMTADPSQHRPELIERVDTLRRNERFCDVAVAVKGKEFKAHEIVLAAASPLFLSSLATDMSLRESSKQRIRIECEEATASVMEDVLKYVYTGNVLITEKGAQDLIAVADYLLLPGLKTLASDLLKEIMTIENCVFTYCFADKYQCMALREKSLEMINLNFTVVMKTGDFLNLDAKQVMEWVSSDDITVGAEEEVFKGIVKWVSHNKSEREKNFPDLLCQVRLRSISHDFLLNELVKEELITMNNQCLNFVLGSLKWIFYPTNEFPDKPPRKCLDTQIKGIFVCGGRKALCYLPQQNTWYKLADMMFEHQSHCLVQCKDKLYILDGQVVKGRREGQRPQFVIEYYMPSINSYGTLQRSYYEIFSSLSVLNGDVYAMVNTLGVRGRISIQHLERNDRVIVEGFQTDHYGPCCVSDGRHLYVIGVAPLSVKKFVGSARVVRFDPNKNRWEEVAPMNESRRNAFGASMSGKIYIAGGTQNHKHEKVRIVLDSCEMYNPSTDEWQMMPSLNAPRIAASMVCFQGALYVIGGITDTGNKRSRELLVEMFDSETSEWKKKSSIPVNHENQEKRQDEMHYKACFATLNKDVFEEAF